MSVARGTVCCVLLTLLALAADGCSGPSCIRNSDCPVDQSCMASTCQLPAAGSSAAGSSGQSAATSGKGGTAGSSGVGGGAGAVNLDAGVTDAGPDAQTP